MLSELSRSKSLTGMDFIVKKQYSQSFLCRNCKWWMILAILLLGAGLRVYRLGDNLFWFDEVGVAKAAEQSSLREAVSISQLYIMSMPLDYVVAWGVAHISHSEAALRLPSAIWGSLTLLAAYFLYREITNEHTAILGMLLLALTPIHIRYSQELKFYSPLVFFYVLASYFALIAIKRKAFPLWIAFLLITMLGILFHIYTTLVLANLTLWVILISDKKNPDRRLWRFFTFSACSVLIFAAVAIALFGKSPSYQTDLFGFESPTQVFLGGLGWIPLFPSNGFDFMFGGLCMVFAAVGLITSLSGSSNRSCFAIPISIFFQGLLIVSGDAMKGYFVYSRQFLVLVPLMVLLTALGIEKAVNFVTSSAQIQTSARQVGLLLVSSIFLISAIPLLSQYYQTQRVDTRAVINWLSANWQDGQTVYIDPAYESLTYSFYLQGWGSIKDDQRRLTRISESLYPLDLDLSQNNLPDVDYLITNFLDDQQASFLKSKGFDLKYTSPFNVLEPQMIWHRTETS